MSLTVVVRLRSLSGNALADLLRRQAGVDPDDADHRNIDLGENVRGHLEQHKRCCEEDQQRHYQKRVRPPQRNFNDPHYLNNLCLRSAVQAQRRPIPRVQVHGAHDCHFERYPGPDVVNIRWPIY